MFVDQPLEIKTSVVNIKIKKSCGKDNHGHWHCVNCNKNMINNFGAFQHNDEFPKHKIVWFCGDHGFETI